MFSRLPTRAAALLASPPALLALLACALGLLEVVTPVGLDQGILAYIGADILDGGVPYRDTWDHKPPGSHYLFALGLGLLGRTVAAIRLLDMAVLLLTALALYALAARLFRREVGLLAGACFLLLYATRLSWWDKAQPDGFMLLPALCGLRLALLAEERQRSGYALAAGLALGVAALFKFVALALLAPAALALLAGWWRHRRWRLLLGRAAALALGVALPHGLLLLAFLGSGALGPYLEAVTVFNRGYVLQAYRGDAARLWQVAAQLDLVHVLAAAALASLLALPLPWPGALRRARGEAGFGVAFTWLTLLALTLEVVLQAKYYFYHLAPLLVPVSLLAGAAVATARRLLAAVAPRSLAALAAGLLLGTALLPRVAETREKVAVLWSAARGGLDREAYYRAFGGYGDGGGFSYLACSQAAAYLRRTTRPGDRLFVWGFDPLLPFLAGRKLATRFTYNTPLIVPWRPPRWRQELLAALRRDPPAVWVFLRNDQHPWTTTRERDSYDVMQEDFPRLRRLLEARYKLEKEIEDYRIYRLR